MGDYSSGDVAALPGTSANLDHVYDGTDLANVGTNDTNYVNQTGSSGYELHQYKDSITATSANVTWIGKSSLAPSSSKVQLQVYKVAAPAGWEDVSGAGASNNVAGADTDFTLSGTVTTADYLDSGVIAFRVYQAAGSVEELVASWPIENFSGSNQQLNLSSGVTKISQSFQSNGDTLTKVKFRFGTPSGTPPGNCVVNLFLDGGSTPGTDSAPTGSVLATVTVLAATVAGGLDGDSCYTFTFTTPYDSAASTYYCVTFEHTPTDDLNYFWFSIDTDSAGAFAGNYALYWGAAWHPAADTDAIFYVWGNT